MDKRKGYVLLLINACVRSSVSECKKSRRLLHYVQWHPVITLASKRAFRVLLLELTVTDQNIAFLVLDSCWATDRNGNSVRADVTDDVPLKTFRTTLVSAIFRQFGSCIDWGPHGLWKHDRKYIKVMVANLWFFFFLKTTKRYSDETCLNMFRTGVFTFLQVRNSNWPPNMDKSCIIYIHVWILWETHLIFNQTAVTDNNFTKLCIKLPVLGWFSMLMASTKTRYTKQNFLLY
jgi:hypothetical protein